MGKRVDGDRRHATVVALRELGRSHDYRDRADAATPTTPAASAADAIPAGHPAEHGQAGGAGAGQQLFLADLVRRVHLAAAARPRGYGAPAAHQQPDIAFWATPRWRQEPLFIAARDMSRVTVPDVTPIDAAFTAYVATQADASAETQGWSPALRERVQNSLCLLTAVHGPHETIKASTVATLPRQQNRRAVIRVTEVLAHLALLDDDRIDPLDAWIHRRLASVHPEIREEVLVWIRIVRHGGPRRRPPLDYHGPKPGQLRDPVPSCLLAALPHPSPGQPCRRHRMARRHRRARR